LSNYAGEVGRNISDQAVQFTGQASERMQSGLGYMLREQPLAIAVVGLAVGAAAAALLPPTEVEARTFGAAGGAIADTASQMGSTLMDAAGEAGERLKQRAEERGLTANNLKDMAKEAVTTFASKAAGSADEANSGNRTQQNRDTP
jgi:hypothetical protein